MATQEELEGRIINLEREVADIKAQLELPRLHTIVEAIILQQFYHPYEGREGRIDTCYIQG